MVTANKHRRRGAGSLLVKWGIEMSEATGLPCYLQASEQGRRLYRQYGFGAVNVVEFDLSRYGLEGTETMTEMIRGPGTEAAGLRNNMYRSSPGVLVGSFDVRMYARVKPPLV